MPGQKPGRPTNNPKGRPKGVPNKANIEVKALAQQYTQEALDTLAVIMRQAESQPARVSAAKELLDRGHGRAAQSVEMTGKDGGPVLAAIKIQFVGGANG